MTGKDEDPIIVDMKQWKKTADKKADAQKKTAQKAQPIGSNPLVQKLLIAAAVLALLWFAMPAGYLNTLFSTITGSGG